MDEKFHMSSRGDDFKEKRQRLLSLCLFEFVDLTVVVYYHRARKYRWDWFGRSQSMYSNVPFVSVTPLVSTDQSVKFVETMMSYERPASPVRLMRAWSTIIPAQRLVDLPFTPTATGASVAVTDNPNLAPPGWYMLFVVDANGVPSGAQWVHLS